MPANAKKIEPAAIQLIADQVTHIPLELIDRDENQPRIHFDVEALKELAADIKQNGVQQPVTLRDNPAAPGRFLIVYGERRVNASRIAKRITIPALPYSGKTTGKNADLERLLAQAKENTQREDLNPMDLAHFFHTLNKVHKKTQPQIEKLLKDHAVGNYGRSYISNILMLLKLPEWAQDMVKANKLTAAHGKYLLPAMASDKVAKLIQKKLEGGDWEPNTRELQLEIYYKFQGEHNKLTSYETKFDHQKKCIKTGCKKLRKITSGQVSNTFCLDKACYLDFQNKEEERRQKRLEKQREKIKSQPPIEVKPDKNNRVDIDQLDLCPEFSVLTHAEFDNTGCNKCPHHHIAVEEEMGEKVEYDACFDANCFEEKSNTHRQATGVIKQHMTQTIATQLNENPALAFRILAWIAADRPDGVGENGNGEYIHFNGSLDPGYEDEFENVLFKHRLFSLPQFLLADERVMPNLLKAMFDIGIRHSSIKELWKHFKLDITDFQLDEAYLYSLKGPALQKLVGNADLPVVIVNEFHDIKEIEPLREKILQHREHIKFSAPADEIRFAYQQLMKEESTEDE